MKNQLHIGTAMVVQRVNQADDERLLRARMVRDARLAEARKHSGEKNVTWIFSGFLRKVFRQETQ